MLNRMDLGERIKYARTGAGLTQTELANAAGVTKGSVSQWEMRIPRQRDHSFRFIVTAYSG